MLTGRSAPLSRLIKDQYQTLGLNHIFTPSGFHLSAVLFPFLKLIKSNKWQIALILLIGIGLSFAPGFAALKRMVLIKGHQKILGRHIGFAIALLIDVFAGSFQIAPLSFTYSFLFLGIIYSGFEGVRLIIWFFIAQMILAFFQGNDVSILLLLFSPLLNFLFALILPMLFILSSPLSAWQVETGLFFLRHLQTFVAVCAEVSLHLPLIEVNIFTLVLVAMIIFRKPRVFLLGLALFCSCLNLDHQRARTMARNEFVPTEYVRTIYKEKYVTVIFKDGRCRMNLVRGFWYENCSPLKRSSRKKRL